MGDALALTDFNDALLREGAMSAEFYQLVQSCVLAGLALGALILFVLMFVRRSGTAAAAFALVVLTALSEALLFGILDFVTPGTQILIACLTASALLLFINAVLHTGTENLLIAGLSAIVIGVLLSLGGATATGMDFAGEAQIAVVVAVLLSVGLLGFAMVRNFAANGFVGFSVVIALLATLGMTDALLPVLRGSVPVLGLAVLAGAGILVAALASPFLIHDVRLASPREKRRAKAQMVPTSLFGDEPPSAAPPRRQEHRERPKSRFPFNDTSEETAFEAAPATEERPDERHEAFAAALPSPPAEVEDDLPPRYEEPADPVSNHWRASSAEVAADEYVWDALAHPEVRCGEQVLKAAGAHRADELTPEGLREHLSEESLDTFDEQLLGGGTPESGPFELSVRSKTAQFRLEGRRRVDHDGLLTRIDARVLDVRPIEDKPVETAAFSSVTVSTPVSKFTPVVNLASGKTVGFDVLKPELRGKEDEIRTAIDHAAHALADQLAAAPKAKPFALVDAAEAGLKPGVIASAVGKSVRAHGLPRGAMVVGLLSDDNRSARELAAVADDFRKAGAGFALIVDDPQAKPSNKVRPDMVWINAMDVTGKRVRRTAIQNLSRRFGCPVLVRDVKDELDIRTVTDRGAAFGTGRAFAVKASAPEGGKPQDPVSAMKAKGLR